MTQRIKNILVHTPLWLRGGVERVLSFSLPKWAKNDRTVYLATPEVHVPGLPIPEGITRLIPPVSPTARLSYWDNFLIANKIDLFVFNSYEDIATDIEFLRKKGIHCIRIHHGLFAATLATMPMSSWLCSASKLANADMTVCLNSFDAEALRSVGYNDLCRIPNPIPTDYNNRLIQPVYEKNPIALFVGRLAVEKNIDKLIACFPDVVAKIPSAQLWLTANPNSYSIRDVKSMIRQSGMESCIFLKPATDDPREYYNAASLLVLPSYREGFGMVTVEAKAFGLPTVMFDLENNETVQHGFDGLKAPIGDFFALSECMTTLFCKDEIRVQMGKNALLSVHEYDLSVITQRWEELFTYIATNKSGTLPKSLAPVNGAAPINAVLQSLATAQEEFFNSFYCFMYRHPLFLWILRTAKEKFTYGGNCWRTLRYLLFKCIVPFISLETPPKKT